MIKIIDGAKSISLLSAQEKLHSFGMLNQHSSIEYDINNRNPFILSPHAIHRTTYQNGTTASAEVGSSHETTVETDWPVLCEGSF